MSGDHISLADKAVEHAANPSLRRTLLCMLLFMLDSQYVSSPLLPGEVCKVKRGSGMGEMHSGEVADLGSTRSWKHPCFSTKRSEKVWYSYLPATEIVLVVLVFTSRKRYRNDFLIVKSSSTCNLNLWSCMTRSLGT